MISRCRATIEPGTPIVRDGRDNHSMSGAWVACADPLYVGAGAPLPRREGHTVSLSVGGARGRVTSGISLYGPSYARGRNAPPPRAGGYHLG